MIIAADLTLEKENEVVKTLIKYKEVIAWSMDDFERDHPIHLHA